MPRPQKKRYVCRMPANEIFMPAGTATDEIVLLTVDEYETIRLIDLEGYTQEAAAEQMHIARTTVQGIYDSARQKVADVLVNGKRLRISGGDVLLCKHYGKHCGTGCRKQCHRHCCGNLSEQEGGERK